MYYCKDLNCAGMIEDAKAAIIEALTDGEYNGYYCDLHNELFNTDYHYIYTSDAKKALNEIGVFDAIGVIVEYEKDNFGEAIADFPTDFTNPCEVANMLYYIVGEEVLCDLFDGCELWDKVWNDEATEETNKALVQWLKEKRKIGGGLNMLHVMAYNKDRDVYNELALANNYKQIEPNIPAWREMLKNEELKDETGEPYDWLEVWDDEDDHGINDIIITVEEVVKREEMLKN